jgi:hypothetical protein
VKTRRRFRLEKREPGGHVPRQAARDRKETQTTGSSAPALLRGTVF